MFDSASGISERVGDFVEDHGKWRGCCATLDGKVVFGPCNAPSIPAFKPATGSTASVGNFSGIFKWSGFSDLMIGGTNGPHRVLAKRVRFYYVDGTTVVASIGVSVLGLVP